MDNLNKPSPGKELIDKIKRGEILRDIKEQEEEKTEEDYASRIQNGVEVVDVKPIPLHKGLPVPEKRKTWDKP